MERFVVVHGQIILNQFKNFPKKSVANSAFATGLKARMELRRHCKLYMASRAKARVRGLRANPMRDRAHIRMKPMTATATTMVKAIWRAYFMRTGQLLAGACLPLPATYVCWLSLVGVIVYSLLCHQQRARSGHPFMAPAGHLCLQTPHLHTPLRSSLFPVCNRKHVQPTCLRPQLSLVLVFCWMKGQHSKAPGPDLDFNLSSNSGRHLGHGNNFRAARHSSRFV